MLASFIRTSIVVPTLDRAGLLGRTFQSVTSAIDPPVAEILVVHNGSTGNTLEVFKAAPRHFPIARGDIFTSRCRACLAAAMGARPKQKGNPIFSGPCPLGGKLVLGFAGGVGRSWRRSRRWASKPIRRRGWRGVEADGGQRLGALNLIDCGRSIKEFKSDIIFCVMTPQKVELMSAGASWR
jgi:glycosyltransferase involved in cell wall biosynthesis